MKLLIKQVLIKHTTDFSRFRTGGTQGAHRHSTGRYGPSWRAMCSLPVWNSFTDEDWLFLGYSTMLFQLPNLEKRWKDQMSI